jgi:hypothetical protein
VVKYVDNGTVSVKLQSAVEDILGGGEAMSPQEKLSEVQKFIDQSFADGKPLDEVLKGIDGYLKTLEAKGPSLEC